MSFPERVAVKAADVQVGRLLLSLLALPFYVLGFAVGIGFAAIAWVYTAAVIGFRDVVAERSDGDDDAG
jgi:hypothetical protein